MARLKKNYEQSLYARFVRWLHGEENALDRAMEEDLSHAPVKAEHFTTQHEQKLEELYLRKIAREEEREQKAYARIHAWSGTRGAKIVRRLYAGLAVVVAAAIIFTLLLTVAQLPSFGNKQNPLNNEVSRRYLEDGLEEGGATNLVANMILDYRAFDTLGESNVLFIAVCSVILLLRVSQEKNRQGMMEKSDAEQDDRVYEPKNDAILQKAAAFLVPVILLFGIYIILNGHLSPGGGFSGGAVMGAGLILYLNAFGFRKTERFFTFRTFKVVSFTALSFYALSKAYSFFTGANGLESGIGTGTPGAILSAGLILPLNIAVGLVVACTMYAFYTLFRKGDF